ncbi:alpha-amylase family glycosyl hydrolase [Flavobacterium capsici]|uniref:Alpha-amylase family glycosyl hydrolase n=1 Tax=Flavobacterium capsici TaxID=3075618 RepID=A0AA96ETF9_9FLAO|nr:MULTISPECIES: alpha-amylase family glycosyl hydrolase [unclassified Flavobacterium]WNM18379.1 alpha-amylase family glycosyl hydrolase [Flavobacterium sp. PMR2A8]WNM22430.1 alpha-amylase family glycosyl hydrolase [Flavobacterium sp. PMTSA4]
MKPITFYSIFFLSIVFSSCIKDKKEANNDSRYQPKEFVELKHPDWSKNATIYEVNVRQFTPEGTFKAFESHLPRIKNMGIDIIWLMPIHPIGVEKRKGTLGSYYSVKDYYGINPEFGTKEDFKHLIDKIHSMGMYVIVDWVANHSSWDNPLAKEHPEWYTKTEDGNFQPTPWYDWDDVIDFDYEQPGIRKYMTEALVYWVKDFNIDGYRCDTAGFLPTDFWDNARAEMDAVKPVFMLAEWESKDLLKNAFDMTYSWTLWDKMTAVTRDKKSIASLVEYMAHDVSTFPRDGYRMTFTDNHDKNSWEGNMVTNFGDGLEASMVLCGTVNGMPLVYGGQEAGLNRSLKFFDKDLIDWSKMPYENLYKKIFDLKHQNQALWNGKEGGVMVRIFNDKLDQVISFSRTKDNDKVVTIINYSDKPTTVKLNSKNQKGTYTELFSEEKITLNGDDVFELKPWQYYVLVK